jgi:hypothetical protein
VLQRAKKCVLESCISKCQKCIRKILPDIVLPCKIVPKSAKFATEKLYLKVQILYLKVHFLAKFATLKIVTESALTCKIGYLKICTWKCTSLQNFRPEKLYLKVHFLAKFPIWKIVPESVPIYSDRNVVPPHFAYSHTSRYPHYSFL